MAELDPRLVAPKFNLDDAQRAGDTWGLNCGPAALALVAGKTPDEIRPLLGNFEAKRYMNPTLMFDSLERCGINWKRDIRQWSNGNQGVIPWPKFGLVRVQWEGPWTAPGVPIRVRYRHTHWVASMAVEGEEQNIFDINCICVGGWVSLSEWSQSVVPWLLKQCVPKANGKWHLTHVIEVPKPQ